MYYDTNLSVWSARFLVAISHTGQGVFLYMWSTRLDRVIIITSFGRSKTVASELRIKLKCSTYLLEADDWLFHAWYCEG